MPSAGSDAAFLARNAAESLPAGGLEHKLQEAAAQGRPLRVKLGLDPTAPDIHLGHTVVLQKLREFQDRGHRVVLIVGDYTARIGDPSGRSETRPVLSAEEIEANARTYERQAFRVIDADRERYELRFNGEWLDMRMEELFRLARTTTVAQLLDREDFATRYAAGAPISVLELLYPLMQGYDSVAVRADVELGGTDQTFNLLLARDIQRHYGIAEQAVLTLPILPGIDGVEKMSKTKGNQIGIAEPPEEMFGKTMRLPDDAMASWFELLAVDPPVSGTAPRDAKRGLARALVERFHGAQAAAAAEAHFDRVFVAHELPDEIGESTIEARDGVVHVPAALASAFGVSRSEARRLLAQGGVRLAGEELGPDDLDLPAVRVDGSVVQLGRRRFRRLQVRG
ncbi:MAG TPA: tyrosine--tRNA ligase [Solirubrobacteraceae bacterium]|nr:tyrosine--tRNA ligase [Solirubrobacteraceae bacterium]